MWNILLLPFVILDSLEKLSAPTGLTSDVRPTSLQRLDFI